MKPDVPPPTASRNAVAAYWLTRNRADEMDAAAVRAFNVWLDRDPANRAAYDEAERLWDVFGAAGDDPALITSSEQDARRFNRQARASFVGRIAAGLVLVSVSGWALHASGVLSEIGLAPQPAAQELRTGVGQRTMVTLRDKSIVTLDTDTIVRLHESLLQRRVELVRGRAFFEVAKDPSRPFIVAAAGKTVRATGTAFDVRVDGAALQVTLVEGRVRVAAQDALRDAQVADMRAGWRLDADVNAPWRVAPVDVNKETSWHDGRLSFYLDPLAKAVDEMNRYSERKIVFRGEIPERTVVGVFSVGDMDGFVKALELNKIARVTVRSKDRIELVAR